MLSWTNALREVHSKYIQSYKLRRKFVLISLSPLILSSLLEHAILLSISSGTDTEKVPSPNAACAKVKEMVETQTLRAPQD